MPIIFFRLLLFFLILFIVRRSSYDTIFLRLWLWGTLFFKYYVLTMWLKCYKNQTIKFFNFLFSVRLRDLRLIDNMNGASGPPGGSVPTLVALGQKCVGVTVWAKCLLLEKSLIRTAQEKLPSLLSVKPVTVPVSA